MTRTWLERAAILLALLAAGWGAGRFLGASRIAGWGPPSGRVRVLTTVFPLYDFVREIGGADVEAHNLLPPGVDPHEFALSPHDAVLVSGADLLVANGAGLDDFLTEAVRKADVSGKPIVRASDGLPRLASAEEEEHGDHHETGDPHLWLDPVNARHYVRRIASALVTAARSRGQTEAARRIQQRAASYSAALGRLDADYARALSALPGRAFIAFHGAFGYLARRYGLDMAATWQTTPGREPSPRDVSRILGVARRHRVRALFSEPQFSHRALEIIAADSRLPVYTLDPVETAVDFSRAHYLDIMRRNLAVLVRALGG